MYSHTRVCVFFDSREVQEFGLSQVFQKPYYGRMSRIWSDAEADKSCCRWLFLVWNYKTPSPRSSFSFTLCWEGDVRWLCAAHFKHSQGYMSVPKRSRKCQQSCPCIICSSRSKWLVLLHLLFILYYGWTGVCIFCFSGKCNTGYTHKDCKHCDARSVLSRRVMRNLVFVFNLPWTGFWRCNAVLSFHLLFFFVFFTGWIVYLCCTVTLFFGCFHCFIRTAAL